MLPPGIQVVRLLDPKRRFSRRSLATGNQVSNISGDPSRKRGAQDDRSEKVRNKRALTQTIPAASFSRPAHHGALASISLLDRCDLPNAPHVALFFRELCPQVDFD